jgi:hypothetical protein
MITIFNRQELLTTFSGQVQASVCGALAAEGIQYTVRTPGAAGGNFDRSRGFPGIQQTVEYCIYVKKEDYERASAAMQNSLRQS